MVGVDSRDAADHSLAALPVSPLALCAQGVGPGLHLVLAFHSVVLAPAYFEPAGRLAGGGRALLGLACATVVSSGRIGRTRRHAGVVTAVERHGESSVADLPASGRLVAQGRAVRLFSPATAWRVPIRSPSPAPTAAAARCASASGVSDYTRRLQDNLEVGARVRWRGHTAVSTSAWPGRAAGLVAAGIGVTPFIA